MAILSWVSQRAQYVASPYQLYWPLVEGAEVPGKPGKQSLVCSNHFEGGRLTNHRNRAATFDFSQAVTSGMT